MQGTCEGAMRPNRLEASCAITRRSLRHGPRGKTTAQSLDASSGASCDMPTSVCVCVTHLGILLELLQLCRELVVLGLEKLKCVRLRQTWVGMRPSRSSASVHEASIYCVVLASACSRHGHPPPAAMVLTAYPPSAYETLAQYRPKYLKRRLGDAQVRPSGLSAA